MASLLYHLALLSNVPPEQHRHAELQAMAGAFSRFGGQGVAGAVEKEELPNFLRYVVASMNSAAMPQEQVVARSSELTKQLMSFLPAGVRPPATYRRRRHAAAYTTSHHARTRPPTPTPQKQRFSLDDILGSTDKIIVPPPAAEAQSHERGQLGSKQLKALRTRLERNRLTMPLFDTKGWVRDFEKALKIQWEVYANGLSPMHIVVARSDWLYGTTPIV